MHVCNICIFNLTKIKSKHNNVVALGTQYAELDPF